MKGVDSNDPWIPDYMKPTIEETGEQTQEQYYRVMNVMMTRMNDAQLGMGKNSIEYTLFMVLGILHHRIAYLEAELHKSKYGTVETL